MQKHKNCGNVAAWATFVVIELSLNVTLKSRKKILPNTLAKRNIIKG